MLVTIPEAGAALGLSRTTMYELIGAGDIEVVHIGRAARVPVDSLAGFIDRLRSVSHPAGTVKPSPFGSDSQHPLPQRTSRHGGDLR